MIRAQFTSKRRGAFAGVRTRPIAIVALASALSLGCTAGHRDATGNRGRDTPPAVTAQNAEVAALVRSVQQRVEETRGLPAKRELACESLDVRKLKEILAKSIDEQLPPDILPYYQFALRRWGLAPRDRGIADILVSLFTEQIAGLYDQDTARLYVMRSFNLKTTLAEIILAHEICHALQDQHYDLSRWPLKEQHSDDAAYSALAVLEGDATLLMNEYAARYIRVGRLIFDLPGMMVMMGSQPNLQQAPYFIQQQLMFPYLQGARFVETAIARGQRDDVFARRPQSTEQIIHPEKYFSPTPDEPEATPLKALDRQRPWGWRRQYHNTMGEIGARLLLETHFAPDAVEAAAGWGGDVYAVYAPQPLISWRKRPPTDRELEERPHALVWWTRWDTPQDAAEFARAFERIVRERIAGSPPTVSSGGLWRFETSGATYLIRLAGRDVVYVDASSAALAQRFGDASLPQ